MTLVAEAYIKKKKKRMKYEEILNTVNDYLYYYNYLFDS